MKPNLLNAITFLIVAATAAVSGCGGRSSPGGNDDGTNDLSGNDIQSDGALPDTDAWVPEGTISRIQKSDLSVICPPAGTDTAPGFQNGETDLVIDVVITAPKMEASSNLDRYFVAEAGLTTARAWAGAAMTVKKDLGLPDFQVGDVLTITAGHLEYYCMTQLSASAASKLDSGSMQNPVDIDAADIGSQDPATAEQYEGVLVRVKNVRVTNANLGYGQFEVTGGLAVGPAYGITYQPALDDGFDEITGVVDYSYGKYVLLPRSNDDLVLEGGQQIDVIEPDMIDPPDIRYDLPEGVEPPSSLIALQSSADSTGCTSTSSIKTIKEGLTLKSLTVVSPKYVAKKDKLDGYYVCQGLVDPLVPYSCMAMTIDIAAPEKFVPGDVIDMEGKYIEYYCFSELTATSATKTGTTSVPAAIEIDPADLGGQNAGTAEPLEGVLVKVSNVEITESPANGSDGKDHGAFKVTGDLIVGNDFYLPYMAQATDGRVVGQKFLSITGVVSYSFGRYELMPRTMDDLEFDGDPIVVEKDQPDVLGQDTNIGTDTGIPTDTNAATYTMKDIQTADRSAACTKDGFDNVLDSVDFAPVIVTTPKFSASTSLDGYYVEDYPVASDRLWHSMAIVAPKSLATAFQPGDVITMTGSKYYEYYCMSQVEIVAAVKNSSDTAPTPVSVSAALLEGGGLADKATSESYESSLITIQGPLAIDATPADTKSWFSLGNGIEVSNQFYISGFTPTEGAMVAQITGVVRYHFGKYRIAPRTAADIVLIN